MDLVIKEFAGDNTPEERAAHQANLDSALEERDKDKFDRELSSVSKLKISKFDPQSDFESLRFVTDAMKTNSSVNSLKADDMHDLAESLGDNVRVATLFADMLKENKGIKNLDLSYNRFLDESMGEIGTALQTNRTLETISLNFNSDVDDGVMLRQKASKGTIDAWRDVIEDNGQLTTINFCGNSLVNDDFCQEAIVPAIQERTTPLRKLDLSENGLADEEVAAELLVAVAKNVNIGPIAIDTEAFIAERLFDDRASSLEAVGERNMEFLDLQQQQQQQQQQQLQQLNERGIPAVIEFDSLNRRPQARQRSDSFAQEETISKKSRSESYGR